MLVHIWLVVSRYVYVAAALSRLCATPSVFVHLFRHLFHFAFGMHLHVPFGARIVGDLVRYLLCLALVVQVRITPGACVFGHPLRKIFFGLRRIYGHVTLQGHVLHHPPGIRLLLGHLARVIGRLHRLHGFHRLHRLHGLHRLHRIFPEAGQRTRLDVALFDPPDNLAHPLVGRPRPRLDPFPGLLICPTHLFVHPALGFPLPPLLLAHTHVASWSVIG